MNLLSSIITLYYTHVYIIPIPTNRNNFNKNFNFEYASFIDNLLTSSNEERDNFKFLTYIFL